MSQDIGFRPFHVLQGFEPQEFRGPDRLFNRTSLVPSQEFSFGSRESC